MNKKINFVNYLHEKIYSNAKAHIALKWFYMNLNSIFEHNSISNTTQ